ncbi:hypothetical protein B2I21_27985 [Chryseobacterium mucoviscidosis]|nr:hypothetical protein B2I21_27985 [Chryseobacterium mucoviscidosis]
MALDETVKNDVSYILRQRELNPNGYNSDRKRLGRSNFVILKAAVDNKINAFVGKEVGMRHEISRPELDVI